MYAETHRHGSRKDALVNAIATHCDSEGILMTKDMLIQRHSSTNRSNGMASTEDIIKGLKQLDEDGIEVTRVTQINP